MTIKQLGGVFGRNPTFNDVTIEGQLTFDGDIDINSDLKVDGDLDVTGGMTVDTDTLVVDDANNRVGVGTAAPLVKNETKISTSGLPASTGTAQPNACFRAASSATTGIIDIGIFGANSWIQATDRGDLSQGYNLSLNPNGGDVKVGNGNLVISTSGKGIDFSATAGTGTSELFDDYEEGVWTPAYTGASGSASYNVQSGTYTKVGREVTVIGELQASRNTLTGNITISGLPFASSGNGGGMLVTFAILFDSDMPNLRGYATSTSLSLRKQATNASGSTSVTASDLSIAAINHNYLYFSATYFTT